MVTQGDKMFPFNRFLRAMVNVNLVSKIRNLVCVPAMQIITERSLARSRDGEVQNEVLFGKRLYP